MERWMFVATKHSILSQNRISDSIKLTINLVDPIRKQPKQPGFNKQLINV